MVASQHQFVNKKGDNEMVMHRSPPAVEDREWHRAMVDENLHLFMHNEDPLSQVETHDNRCPFTYRWLIILLDVFISVIQSVGQSHYSFTIPQQIQRGSNGQS